jgi:hypothetical protein
MNEPSIEFDIVRAPGQPRDRVLTLRVVRVTRTVSHRRFAGTHMNLFQRRLRRGARDLAGDRPRFFELGIDARRVRPRHRGDPRRFVGRARAAIRLHQEVQAIGGELNGVFAKPQFGDRVFTVWVGQPRDRVFALRVGRRTPMLVRLVGFAARADLGPSIGALLTALVTTPLISPPSCNPASILEVVLPAMTETMLASGHEDLSSTCRRSRCDGHSRSRRER